MTTYTLTAVLGAKRRRRTFQAADRTDATFTAIRLILDAAYDAPSDDPWRFGRIELRDQDGKLVQEMDAKTGGSDG